MKRNSHDSIEKSIKSLLKLSEKLQRDYKKMREEYKSPTAKKVDNQNLKESF